MNPLLKSVFTLKTFKRAVLSLLATYVGTYAVLSCMGHYEDPSHFGGLSDVEEAWFPRSMVILGFEGMKGSQREYFYGSKADYVFLPLVYLECV